MATVEDFVEIVYARSLLGNHAREIGERWTLCDRPVENMGSVEPYRGALLQVECGECRDAVRTFKVPR